MRSFQLRRQLAMGHALTALVLMFMATAVLTARADDVNRAEAIVGAERDAEVLSTQLAPLIVAGQPIDGLLTSTDLRQTEVVGADDARIAGDTIPSPGLDAAIDNVMVRVDLSDSAGQMIDGRALGVAPVLVDDELRAVAVVTEAVPPRRGWRQLYGLDLRATVLLVLLAAALGWWLAARVTRPLLRLTNRARLLVLDGSGPDHARGSSRIREIELLDAAMTLLDQRMRVDANQKHRTEAGLRRVSHELRTPVTTIGLNVDRLEDESCSERPIEVIRGQLARLERLAGQLRTLPTDVGPLPVIDLGHTALLATKRLRPVAEWGNVRLQLHAVESGHIHADPDELEDALANLIENAIKHSPRGGMVDVTLSRVGDELFADVADQGPGIHHNHREIVLQPGVRLLGTHPVAGTGQGLAIVAATVARFNGRLEIADPPHHGALVRLVFPVAKPNPGGSSATMPDASRGGH